MAEPAVVEIDMNEPSSGAENHPSDYAIPGIGGAPAPTTPAAPAPTPATPAAPAPAAPAPHAVAAPVAPPSSDPTQQPGSPAAPTNEPPQYRFDEVIEQRNRVAAAYERQREENEQLRQQNATITTLLQRLVNGGGQPGAPAGQPQTPQSPADEAAMKALERLYAVAPHLKKLEPIAAKVDEILGFTTDMVPRMQQRERQYWETVSQHMYGRLWDTVAPRILGDGKASNDLPQPVRDRYARDFYNWLHEDRSRGERYSRLDSTLIDDFISEIDSAYVAPVRQRYGAEVAARAAQVQALPVAGPAQAPVASPTPKVNVNDETAVHDAAWKAMVAATSR